MPKRGAPRWALGPVSPGSSPGERQRAALRKVLAGCAALWPWSTVWCPFRVVAGPPPRSACSVPAGTASGTAAWRPARSQTGHFSTDDVSTQGTCPAADRSPGVPPATFRIRAGRGGRGRTPPWGLGVGAGTRKRGRGSQTRAVLPPGRGSRDKTLTGPETSPRAPLSWRGPSVRPGLDPVPPEASPAGGGAASPFRTPFSQAHSRGEHAPGSGSAPWMEGGPRERLGRVVTPGAALRFSVTTVPLLEAPLSAFGSGVRGRAAGRVETPNPGPRAAPV